MTRQLHHAAFAAGLAALTWVGAGYLQQPLALSMTLLIGAFYIAGAAELHRFRQATATLQRTVAATTLPPEALAPWLQALHPSLRHAVRLRIEGGRSALPGPALAPYLAGLLVLLGMLGTFLGMVVTLNGTGLALDGATDLPAIRQSLSAPVKGLGLAFGTSVAGVAASAMLGLMAALARRERLQAAQQLDACIDACLRSFTQAQRSDDTFVLLQRQAEAMPLLVDRLQALMDTMERQGQALNDRLLAGQETFHAQAGSAYAGLAASVGRALQDSLAAGAQAAGDRLQPVVQATMAGIARETATLHGHLTQAVQQQLDGVAGRLDEAGTAMAARWSAAHDGFGSAFERQSAQLLRSIDEAHARQQAQAAAHDTERLARWTAGLAQAAARLEQSWQQTAEAAAAQQQQVAALLARTADEMAARTEAQARSTIGEIRTLLQAAGEAPRAAAEVVGELRRALSDSMARDNGLLEERSRLLGTLSTLLDAVNQASHEQRAAIDTLVAGAGDLLQRAGSRLGAQADAQAAQLADAAAQLTGSAVEVASLGEAFGVAVQQFDRSGQGLVSQLERIEAALGQSMARSDEQLGYYVAQAREVIDLSILSQKQIVEELQQLARRPAAAVGADA